MIKRTTGQRIVDKWRAEWTPYADEMAELSKLIDRAIRRAQAKAWDDGWIGGSTHIGLCENPYRGRAKR